EGVGTGMGAGARAGGAGSEAAQGGRAVTHRRQETGELASMLIIGGLALVLGAMLAIFGDGPPEVYVARAAALTGILAAVAFTLAWIVRGHRLPPEGGKNGDSPPPPPPAEQAREDPPPQRPRRTGRWGRAHPRPGVSWGRPPTPMRRPRSRSRSNPPRSFSYRPATSPGR